MATNWNVNINFRKISITIIRYQRKLNKKWKKYQ